jgi:hypothetical protein
MQGADLTWQPTVQKVDQITFFYYRRRMMLMMLTMHSAFRCAVMVCVCVCVCVRARVCV